MQAKYCNYRGRELARYDRGWIRGTVRDLSRIDDRGNALTLAFQWAVIVSAAVAALALDRWWAYLAAGILIGSRLQFLAVLMHDACHYTLFSRRRVNDLVGDLLVSYPLGISLHLYRASHFRHHRFTNSEQDHDFAFQSRDPDQAFPKSPAQMAWLLVKSAAGLNLIPMLRFARVWVPSLNLHNPAHLDIDFTLRLRLRYLAWVAVVFGAIVASPFTLELLGLYLVPLFFWSNVFNRMRAMAEHNGVLNTHELNGTRTVLPTALDRFFVVPFNVSFHIEHHMFPSVPGRNLRRLHEKLLDDPEFRARAHLTRGYSGVFRELTSPRSATSTSLPTVRPD